jgi:hypothetical protein
MTLAGLRHTIEREELEILEGLRREIRGALSRAKMEIDREIRTYPTPIPRCDAQFNHLHDQRERLARELDRIGADDGTPPGGSECLEIVERFVASVPCGDQPAERELRSKVKARLLALAERGRE